MKPWMVLMTVVAALGWAQAGTTDGPVRLPVGVKGPERLKYADPEYPVSLRQQGASGFVCLDIVIGEAGQVESVDVLEGTAGFNEAAIQAVRQWTYEPPSLEGRPVRLATVVAVSFFVRPDRPEKLLVRALGHPNPLVREASARSLGASGKRAVDPLTKALADENPRVRATAAVALGKIGRAAKKAAPVLKLATRDADATVRDAAAKALEAVEAK